MAITETYNDFVTRAAKRTYTTSEAVELTKFMDRHYPTSQPLRWSNAKTKKEWKWYFYNN